MAADLDAAETLLQETREAGAPLSPLDLSRLFGFESTSILAKLADRLNHINPFSQSTEQRIATALEYSGRQTRWELHDDRLRIELETWFHGLSPEEQFNLEFEPPASPNALFQGVTLRVKDVQSGILPPPRIELIIPDQEEEAPDAELKRFIRQLQLQNRHIDLGYLLELPDEVAEKLPESALAQFKQRRDAWRQMGIETSGAASEFVHKHFRTRILYLDRKLPHEVAKVIELVPSFRKTLERLESQGVTVELVKCIKTPECVLEAIQTVSKTQEGYVSTWLPPLIQRGLPPKITRADFDRVRAQHQRKVAKTTKNVDPDSFRGRLINHALAGDLDSALKLWESVQTIAAFSEGTLTLTARGADAQSLREIQKINTLLKGMGREYASRLARSDKTQQNSEMAQTILKIIFVIAPVTDFLQNVLKVGPLAKCFAGSGDNVAEEVAELSSLRLTGVSEAEIRKRMAVMTIAVAVAGGADFLLDLVSSGLGDQAAGALFMASSVSVSAAAGFYSVWMFAQAYRRLANEGKLPNHLKLDPQVIGRLKELATEHPSKTAVEAAIAQAMTEQHADESEIAFVRSWISQANDEDVVKALLDNSKPVRWTEVLGASFKESMAVNTMRAGLTIGTYSAPIIGWEFGPQILHNIVALSLSGSWEFFVAALVAYLGKLTFDPLWADFVRRQKALSGGDENDGKEEHDPLVTPQ